MDDFDDELDQLLGESSPPRPPKKSLSSKDGIVVGTSPPLSSSNNNTNNNDHHQNSNQADLVCRTDIGDGDDDDDGQRMSSLLPTTYQVGRNSSTTTTRTTARATMSTPSRTQQKKDDVRNSSYQMDPPIATRTTSSSPHLNDRLLRGTVASEHSKFVPHQPPVKKPLRQLSLTNPLLKETVASHTKFAPSPTKPKKEIQPVTTSSRLLNHTSASEMRVMTFAVRQEMVRQQEEQLKQEQKLLKQRRKQQHPKERQGIGKRKKQQQQQAKGKEQAEVAEKVNVEKDDVQSQQGTSDNNDFIAIAQKRTSKIRELLQQQDQTVTTNIASLEQQEQERQKKKVVLKDNDEPATATPIVGGRLNILDGPSKLLPYAQMICSQKSKERRPSLSSQKGDDGEEDENHTILIPSDYVHDWEESLRHEGTLRPSSSSNSLKDDHEHGYDRKPVTIPMAPKFHTLHHHEIALKRNDDDDDDDEREKPILNGKSWESSLRQGDSFSTPSKSIDGDDDDDKSIRSITRPVSPTFHHVHPRPLPKSSAEMDDELMMYYETHPFKATPNRMYDDKYRSISPVSSSHEERHVTVPVPFHFNTSTRTTSYPEEPPSPFKAKPIPDYYITGDVGGMGIPDVESRPVTIPQPFHFQINDRLGEKSIKSPPPESKTDFKALPMPDYLGQDVLSFLDRGPDRLEYLAQPRIVKSQPKDQSKPFKALPLPKFYPKTEPSSSSSKPSKTVEQQRQQERKRPVVPASKKKPLTTITTTSEDPPTTTFKARRMPDFTKKPKIPVKSQRPGGRRLQFTNTNKPISNYSVPQENDDKHEGLTYGYHAHYKSDMDSVPYESDRSPSSRREERKIDPRSYTLDDDDDALEPMVPNRTTSSPRPGTPKRIAGPSSSSSSHQKKVDSPNGKMVPLMPHLEDSSSRSPQAKKKVKSPKATRKKTVTQAPPVNPIANSPADNPSRTSSKKGTMSIEPYQQQISNQRETISDQVQQHHQQRRPPQDQQSVPPPPSKPAKNIEQHEYEEMVRRKRKEGRKFKKRTDKKSKKKAEKGEHERKDKTTWRKYFQFF